MTFVTSFRYFVFKKWQFVDNKQAQEFGPEEQDQSQRKTRKSIEILFLYLPLLPISVERINDKVKVGVITP